MPEEHAPSLRRHQEWMLHVVTHPHGVVEGSASAFSSDLVPEDTEQLTDIVPGNDRVDAEEQMHIYGFMYFARLIEVMEAEYPTVRFLLGEEAFAGHARHFLSLNPSNNPNLSHLSRDFPDFLAEDARDLTHRGFAHALAQVERTLEELFDAPGDEPVAMEVLSAIPMERWANARLKTPRAFRLLRLSYPVNAFLNARRADHFAPVPELQPTLMVCFRRGFSLRRLELSEVQYGLLEALDEGCTLGDALERASDLPDTDEDALLGSLHSWFEGWMSEGLFVAVELD